MISVIIPMYNAENTIIQTRKDFEVIVVDDDSADNSSLLVAEFEFESPSNLSIKEG